MKIKPFELEINWILQPSKSVWDAFDSHALNASLGLPAMTNAKSNIFVVSI